MASVIDGAVGLVLAAGGGSRFGGGKMLARVGGRPILQRVLDALSAAGIEDVVVVLGTDAEAIEPMIAWRAERRVVNPEPEHGLSSSLRVGMDAIGPDASAALIVLGDQPLLSVDVIRSLISHAVDGERPIVVPTYAHGQGRNPVLLRNSAFRFATDAAGDRGLGPILAEHPELVLEVPVAGDNPDVDTDADLAAAAESLWAAQVRANRDQVERIREVPDGADFYAPVRSLFRADPTRTEDPVLDVLLRLVRSGETWLDIGAGAGRFALPLARALDDSGGSVVALDASRSMLESLREIADDHAIENVSTIEGRWPPADRRSISGLDVDVALIAHVGYDIESIGTFLDGMESAARRSCVAVMMERMPAAAADPFWPYVHGETRVALPALSDLIDLLVARGRRPIVERVTAEARRFESRHSLESFARRQLWIDPAGPKESRLVAALDEIALEDGEGWTIAGRDPSEIGVVTWAPGG